MQAKHFALVTILAAVCFVQIQPAVAGGTGSASAPLQERMSYAVFRKLGLDHLSSEQLKGLNAWLAAHGDCGGSMSDAAPRAEQSHESQTLTASRYKSRIAGDFNGWHQDEVLVLQNGQRWRVTDDETANIATMHDPRVTVWRGFFNAWLLSVEGMDTTAHVVPALR